MELNRANLGDIGARLEAISRSIGSEGDSKVGSAGTQGADVLKDLIDLLGKDGSIDKKDVNILKLFLELLSQLGGNDGNKGGEELSRPMGGGGAGGAPQSGGPAGSQAPPASGASGGGEPAVESDARPAPSDQRSTLQQVAQKAYDTIETSANADGKVSTMERAALDMFAKAFGLPPKSEPAPAPAPPPAASSGMTGVLRDMMDSAMKDGKIDKNEARAIGAIIDAMGGKSTLSNGDAQSMLKDLLKGVSADGKFSKDDLSAFTKMLGLVSKDPGRLGPPKVETMAAGSAGAAPEVQGRRVAQRGGEERAADDVAAQLPNVAKSFLQNTLGIGRFGGKQKMEDKDLF